MNRGHTFVPKPSTGQVKLCGQVFYGLQPQLLRFPEFMLNAVALSSGDRTPLQAAVTAPSAFRSSLGKELLSASLGSSCIGAKYLFSFGEICTFHGES